MRKRQFSIIMIICLVSSLWSITAMAAPHILWQKEQDAPKRGIQSAVVVNNYVYCINETGQMLIYHPETNQWAHGSSINVTAINTQRFNLVSVNNAVYAIAVNEAVYANGIYYYNSGSGTWKSVYKDNGYGFIDPQSVVWNGEIYTFGGLSGDAVFAYNLSTPDVLPRFIDRLPNQRRWGKAVLHDYKVYLIGGHDSIGWNYKIDIYDLLTGRWEDGGIIEMGLKYPAAEVIEDHIYVFGGSSAFSPQGALEPTDKIYVYNLADKTWNLDESKLTVARSSAGSAVINNRLYLISGVDQNGSTNFVESFSTRSKQSIVLNVGEEIQLSGKEKTSGGKQLNWSSTDPSIATVNSEGVVTAISQGAVFIHCSNDNDTFTDYVPIKVLDVENIDDYRLAVHLSGVDDTVNLWVNDDNTQVYWYSLNSSVADVDNNGKVTAKSKGLTVIYAQYDGKLYEMYVRVDIH